MGLAQLIENSITRKELIRETAETQNTTLEENKSAADYINYGVNSSDGNLVFDGEQYSTIYEPIKGAHFENPIHTSSEIFDIVNKYRGTLEYTVAVLSGPAGNFAGGGISVPTTTKVVYDIISAPSLFNPYYGVNVMGIGVGTRLLDTENDITVSAVSSGKLYEADNGQVSSSEKRENVSKTSILTPIDDCSIQNLVQLSKQPDSVLGQARYKFSDFMYCRDVGKISNNHLITLRRFDHPVPDNIFRGTTIDDNASLSVKGDIGRLITWFGTEDNKLDDIIKFKYKATWKELNAELQTQPSQESDPQRGVVGGLVNLFSPGYNNASARGVAPNALALILGEDGSSGFFSSAPYAGNPVVNGSKYDNNRVYEPKDTIRSTHIYDGKLEFAHEFTLKFAYKLRGYDNINARNAFLDLLGNILVVTYKSGTFWPGEQRITGAPQNKAGWKKAESFIDKGLDAGGSFITALMNGESFGDAGENFLQTIGGLVSSSFGIDLGDALKDPIGTLKTLGSKAMGAGFGGALKGMFKNQLGRPAVYAFDSLLTNDVVGTWHVTIGNPLNPIVVMGNLIITDCELKLNGPLGLDDFPTEINLTVTLKHATPRDSTDIQRMFTKGRHGIYSKIGNSKNYSVNALGSTKNFNGADGQQYATSTTDEHEGDSLVIQGSTSPALEAAQNRQRAAENAVKNAANSDNNTDTTSDSGSEINAPINGSSGESSGGSEKSAEEIAAEAKAAADAALADAQETIAQQTAAANAAAWQSYNATLSAAATATFDELSSYEAVGHMGDFYFKRISSNRESLR